MIVLFSEPLVKVLQMVDGDKPTVGFIYQGHGSGQRGNKGNLWGKKPKYLPLWRTIDEIWNKQLHRPLHATGYYMNPM